MGPYFFLWVYDPAHNWAKRQREKLGPLLIVQILNLLSERHVNTSYFVILGVVDGKTQVIHRPDGKILNLP